MPNHDIVQNRYLQIETMEQGRRRRDFVIIEILSEWQAQVLGVSVGSK